MSCMKCGRDIEENQLFCSSCLEDMARYPVKPGIAIQLPSRTEAPVSRKAAPKRKQPLTPEEQILRLKKRVRRLVFLVILLLFLLAVTIYPTVEYFRSLSFPLPGQNYSTITNTESTTP